MAKQKPKVGDFITFKAATRWSNGTVRRKVVSIDYLNRPCVRYGGWPDFVVHLHEILTVEAVTVEAPLQFKLIEFNPRRQKRGADAARVEVTEPDGHSYWLWMSPSDLRKNIKAHGEHPELVKALDAYAGKVAA